MIPGGKADRKPGTFIDFTLSRNKPIVLLYDFFTNGQSYPRSVKFGDIMQAPEHVENMLRILLFKTNSVIFHQDPAIFIVFGFGGS